MRACMASVGRVGLFISLGAGTVAMGSQPSTPDPVPGALPPELLEHDARRTYMRSCAGCHGPNMNGGNAGGFRDGVWRYGSDNWIVHRSIKFGHPRDGMPAYGGMLSDAEISRLVDYIKKAPLAPGADGQPIPEVIQTRDYDLHAEVVVDGRDGSLVQPWGIAFIDSGTALITENAGRLRLWRDGSLDPEPVSGIPEVIDRGQGGLMDVAVDPEWDAGEDWVYLTFSHGPEGQGGPKMTKVVRGKLQRGAGGAHSWENEQTVWEAARDDYEGTFHHYGSRITFDNEGLLYFSIGDRGQRPEAQDLSKPNGKVHRVHRDGRVPSSNPFADRGGNVYASVFSYGHRNPQGLAFDPVTGRLWDTEHGPMGGDEVNLVEASKNYGWPVITYGINYNGSVITEETAREGMEQPAWYWTPSIAACGLDVYRGGELEAWEGDLLAGGLAHETVHRLVMDDDRVIHEETVFQGYGRVRDVSVAPDGSVWIALNRPDRIVRLSKKERVWRQ
jgi:glucose/arabinose dehydrogenase